MPFCYIYICSNFLELDFLLLQWGEAAAPPRSPLRHKEGSTAAEVTDMDTVGSERRKTVFVTRGQLARGVHGHTAPAKGPHSCLGAVAGGPSRASGVRLGMAMQGIRDQQLAASLRMAARSITAPLPRQASPTWGPGLAGTRRPTAF